MFNVLGGFDLVDGDVFEQPVWPIYIYGSGMFYTIPPLIKYLKYTTRAGIVLIADNLRPSSYHTLNFRTSGVVSSLLHNPRFYLHCFHFLFVRFSTLHIEYTFPLSNSTSWFLLRCFLLFPIENSCLDWKVGGFDA